ncbi:hypothetical protein [Sphingomonas abietis]|uniref:Uncharacterized protein n=1 Tax=Sphingomonas abietis TaxID=3012344 RepID=A0ABY7NSH7_9SPHN|nr:hypothetical protein [Sphingomonas abietis]WBO24499.1 hypothetical protein PBT88_10545 [Sphingomonas abietis]
MTERRKTLSLRLSAKTPDEAALDAQTLIEQAIAHHLCVRWSYNRTMMRAAPQILYRKKGGVYLDAIVIERGGAAPAETKLGSFKLTGLTHLVITTEAFTPDASIDIGDARYSEGVIARATA